MSFFRFILLLSIFKKQQQQQKKTIFFSLWTTQPITYLLLTEISIQNSNVKIDVFYFNKFRNRNKFFKQNWHLFVSTFNPHYSEYQIHNNPVVNIAKVNDDKRNAHSFGNKTKMKNETIRPKSGPFRDVKRAFGMWFKRLKHLPRRDAEKLI